MLKMEIHLTKKQVEILHAFKDMSSDFVVDESGNHFAILDGYPIGLAGISDEPIEMPFD